MNRKKKKKKKGRVRKISFCAKHSFLLRASKKVTSESAEGGNPRVEVQNIPSPLEEKLKRNFAA